jgi:hypothetical protein
LLEVVETTFEVAHFRRAICEAEGLADVNIFFNGGIEEVEKWHRGVDVKMKEFEVHGACNGEE